MNRESSLNLAWDLHWRSEGKVLASTKNSVMLFGWEGYAKNGNGFSGIVNTFDSVEKANAFVSSQYMAQANLNVLQVVDMKKLTVLSRFERVAKDNGKWSKVA